MILACMHENNDIWLNKTADFFRIWDGLLNDAFAWVNDGVLTWFKSLSKYDEWHLKSDETTVNSLLRDSFIFPMPTSATYAQCRGGRAGSDA